MPWEIDLSGQTVLYRALAAVIVAVAHWFIVVVLALWLGDRGPTQDGRLSLNPFLHADLIGVASGVLTQFPWGRPPNLTPGAMRFGRWSVPLIVAVSLVAILVLARLLWMARPLLYRLLPQGGVGVAGIGFVEQLSQTAVYYVLVNLIPVPPLAAGLLMLAVAPALYARIEKRMPVFSVAVGVAMVLGGGALLLGPARRFAALVTGA